ncbi:beta-3 adrenergic receptor [Biomphalaria glabrata]|nr:hypothetical protein BgiMline_004606 [Biomphalaria glabrata]KAI8794869.1 hypothetical protein BgiBS90_005245 [Biomphalaria glabrata]
MYNWSSEQTTALLEQALQNSSITYSLQHPHSVLVRNLSLGVLGLLGNSLAVTLIAVNKKVKFPLKMTLVSLSINDLAFSVTAILYGLPDWIMSSNDPQCWPVVYIVLSTILLSHCMTCLLAIQNFVAVFLPLKSRLIITNSAALAAVLVTWIAVYFLVLGLLGLEVSSNMQCLALALLSRAGLGALCGVALACIMITVMANMLIFIKLRSRRRISDILNVNLKKASVASVDRTQETEIVSRAGDENLAQSSPGPSGLNSVKNFNDLHFNRSAADQPFKATSDKSIHIATIVNFYQEGNVGHDNSMTENPNEENRNTGNRQSLNYNARIHDELQTGNIFGVNPHNRLPSHSSPPLMDSISSSTKPDLQILRPKLQFTVPSDTVPAVTRHHRNSRMKSTSNTLLIMTCLSCFLAFPLIVDGFYLTIWKRDLQQFASSFFGILVSSLNITHAVANPVLYVWRFVAWKNFLLRLRQGRRRA